MIILPTVIELTVISSTLKLNVWCYGLPSTGVRIGPSLEFAGKKDETLTHT